MPTKTGKDKDGCFAQWGDQKKYHYKCGDTQAEERAKAKADKQGQAIEVSKHTNTTDMKKINLKKFNYINSIADDRSEATILLYKPIGKYMDSDGNIVNGVDGEQFAQELLFLQDKVKTINVRINSVGGSVIEGFSIIQAIKNSAVPVITYNDFFAASIASLILASGHHRVSMDYAVTMIHNPHAENEELSEPENECLELFRQAILIILETSSILSQEQVNEFMNEETYFDSNEAKQFGFIDEIVSTDKEFVLTRDSQFDNTHILNIMNKVSKTKTITNAKSEKDTKLGEESPVSLTNVADIANEDDSEKAAGAEKSAKTQSESEVKNPGTVDIANSDEENGNPENLEKEAGLHGKLTNVMCMEEGASEEDVYDAVKNLMSEHAALKDEHEKVKGKLTAIGEEAKKAHKTKIDAMVNSALTKGAITKEEVISITNLATADFETTKLMLDKLVAPKTTSTDKKKSWSITDYIANTAKDVTNTADFTLEDYWKKAPDKLNEIQKTNPTFYDKLVNEYNAKSKRWK